MNRIIVSIIALILVIAVASFSVLSLDSSCKNLSENLDEIKNAAEIKDNEKAIELTEKALELWDKEERKISLLVDHSEIDEIEKTLKSLPVLARQGSMERLEEQTSIAAERVRHIREKEKISAKNIF